MIEAALNEQRLAERFREIYETRMHSLPICNPRLSVATAGFRGVGPHRVGVLITPWFMNLVLLPGDDEFAGKPSGALVEVALANGNIDFTIVNEGKFGHYLSAVLFRSCEGFTGMKVAKAVAHNVIGQLFTAGTEPVGRASHGTLSRRALLGGG